MDNFQIIIEYDGSSYFGWQRQKKHSSVQEIIEKSLNKIFKKKISLIGAGRTDTGVHSLGQSANFKTTSNLPCSTIKKALNANLPDDIYIKSVKHVNPNFHSRYDANYKWYRYYIFNSKTPPIFNRKYTYHYPYKIDHNTIRKTAKLISGTYDFGWLITTPYKNKTRTISVKTKEDKPFFIIDVTGTGFLYKMVRRICGLLIDINNEKFSIDTLKQQIAKDERVNVTTLPPNGLFLMKVYY